MAVKVELYRSRGPGSTSLSPPGERGKSASTDVHGRRRSLSQGSWPLMVIIVLGKHGHARFSRIIYSTERSGLSGDNQLSQGPQDDFSFERLQSTLDHQ
ncbi:hypothetical protein J6590_078640 [Homalodisca vitripennis]|nr:hypothetical protein J6590_078640 [Homalodisca vitripennis]